MNDYRKYDRRILEALKDNGSLENVLQEYSQELSMSISGALGPAAPLLAPVMIMVLENYVQVLRKKYPRAAITAEILNMVSNTTEVSIPVPNLEEE